MICTHIFDGDIFSIRQQPDVNSDEDATILIERDTTLKRIIRLPGGLVLLQTENPKFPPSSSVAKRKSKPPA